jgi:hypothetical protein
MHTLDTRMNNIFLPIEEDKETVERNGIAFYYLAKFERASISLNLKNKKYRVLNLNAD